MLSSLFFALGLLGFTILLYGQSGRMDRLVEQNPRLDRIEKHLGLPHPPMPPGDPRSNPPQP